MSISVPYGFKKKTFVTKSKLITTPLRQQIINILKQKQFLGAHIRELKEKTNTGIGVLLWHLQVLEEFKYIKRKNINGYVVFILNEYEKQFNPKLKQAELLFKTKNGQQLLKTLLKTPQKEWAISELTRNSQVNKKTTRTMLRKLSKLGINNKTHNHQNNKKQANKLQTNPRRKRNASNNTRNKLHLSKPRNNQKTNQQLNIKPRKKHS